jgi:hypothetical protein
VPRRDTHVDEFRATECDTLPDAARLVAAMVQARDAVENRSWSHPQESMLELDLRFLLIANHTVPASRHAEPR